MKINYNIKKKELYKDEFVIRAGTKEESKRLLTCLKSKKCIWINEDDAEDFDNWGCYKSETAIYISKEGNLEYSPYDWYQKDTGYNQSKFYDSVDKFISDIEEND